MSTVMRRKTAKTEATMISTWKAGSWMTMGALCSSMRRAKLVKWLHSHTVLLLFVPSTRHPVSDQAEDSRSQKTHIGFPIPSSRRCLHPNGSAHRQLDVLASH